MKKYILKFIVYELKKRQASLESRSVCVCSQYHDSQGSCDAVEPEASLEKIEDIIAIKEDLIQMSTEDISVQTTNPNSFTEGKGLDTNDCVLQAVQKGKNLNPKKIVVGDKASFLGGFLKS